MCVCMYVCLPVYTHVCMRVVCEARLYHVRMYVRVFVCVYAGVYVCGV
jgi:hypothetical protein